MHDDFDRLDDAALVAASRVDRDAYAAFYRRWERPLLGYLIRRVPSADMAADLAAETFAGALTSIRRGAGPRGEPAGWLFAIARNKLAELHRRGCLEDTARRELEMAAISIDDAQLAEIERLADDDHIAELVGTLPAAQRTAVIARIVEGRDYPAIAAEQRCSEAVIRQRVRRGLAALRLRIEGQS